MITKGQKLRQVQRKIGKSTNDKNREPHWFDFVALPIMLIICLSIPIFGLFLESIGEVSPTALFNDPKITHIRIYQANQLIGIHLGEHEVTLIRSSQANLDLWLFRKYFFGYGTEIDPLLLSLQYAVIGYGINLPEAYEFILNTNQSKIHPVVSADTRGTKEVVGYYFNLSNYLEKGFIENWINRTSLFLSVSLVRSGLWTHFVTNPVIPIKITYII